MLSYCLKYKNDTKSMNPKVSKTSIKIIVPLPKSATCDIKKIRIC